MAGKRFKDFAEISPETQQVLAAHAFKRATPVQEATIPLFCGNKDVAVDACTGSGKTLAFIIPVVEKLRRLEAPLKKFQVGAVIISPTRELSRQIYEVAVPFFESVPWITSKLLVGGSDPAADVSDLKESGAHILVGTPGRLDDILHRCPFLNLKTVEVLVLDEADRLLDMGFKAQLDAIIKALPKQRRTGLFSATQTEAVIALARAGLRNPVRVNVAVTYAVPPPPPSSSDAVDSKEGKEKRERDSDSEESENEGNIQKKTKKAKGTSHDVAQITPSTLSVQYTVCTAREKLPELISFLKAHSEEKIIVYFLTCACVDYFSTVLPLLSGGGFSSAKKNNRSSTNSAPSSSSSTSGLNCLALHGRMKQAAREATLSSFAEKKAGVLLATDVAARGLDIPDVNWVVQYDAPQDPAAFVHRCGRTARMGRSGEALVYLTLEENAYVDFLRVRKVPLTEAPPIRTVDVESLLSTLRKASESDRAVMESGTRAFVSYIRAYKEHHCKYIFQLDDLKLGDMASCFALLRLPGMPEVKKAMRKKEGIVGFVPSSVDIDSIRFRDKAREKQRKAVLKQKKERMPEDAKKKEKQTNGHGNGQQQQQQQAQQTQQQRLTAAKRRKLEALQELDELNDEYALLKKLKKGKISQKAYDVATGLSSDSEDDIQLEKQNTKNNTNGKQFPKADPAKTTHSTAGTAAAAVVGHGTIDSNNNDSDSDTSEFDRDLKTASVSNNKPAAAAAGLKQRNSSHKKNLAVGLGKDYIGQALKKKMKKKKKKRSRLAAVGGS